MSNERKAQAISGAVLGIAALTIFCINSDIKIWKGILFIGAVVVITFTLGAVYTILKMLAWTILDDIEEVRERRKEEKRREELRKKKKSNVG